MDVRSTLAFALPFALALIAVHAPSVRAAEAMVIGASMPSQAPGPATANAWEVQLEREAFEEAIVGRKALSLPLPDGRRVLVENLRVVADEGDAWSIVGRVTGPQGSESAVFTFGADSMFAVLPTPAGLMVLRTENGQTFLQAAGGLRPPGIAKSGAAWWPSSDIAVPPRSKRQGLSSSRARDLKMASADAPVQIDLLGLISSELARDAASDAAARTEFQHLLAVTNQAFADSGTHITFRLVGIDKVELASALSGRRSLDAITENDPSLGLDVHGRRNQTSADLVALLRPFTPGAAECGIAWLSGFDLSPDSVDAAYGYSMTRTSPCSPYVLAHELGHNLGSHHDETNAINAQGVLQRGAYIESYGLRRLEAPAFATVMAYEFSQAQRIGRFSDPRRPECRGVSCGVAGYADNVSSLRRMAARIAAFRAPGEDLRILVGDVREGDTDADVPFSLVWSTPAPAEGRQVRLRLVGGTASAGADFEALEREVLVAPGETKWSSSWRLRGDALDEGDETLDLVVDTVLLPARELARARLTVIDDDPKVRVSGDLVFSGADAPVEGATLHWLVADAAGVQRMTTPVRSPQYGFSLSVPSGARVLLDRTTVAAPFSGVSADFGVVSADLERRLTLNSRVRFEGRLSFPEGAPLPTGPLRVFVSGHDTPGAQQTFDLVAPDFAFSVDARFGSTVTVRLFNPGPPWFGQQEFRAGPLRERTQQAFMVQRGVLLRGRVAYDSEVPQPVSRLEVFVNEDGDAGQFITPVPVVNGRFEAAVRPGYSIWVDALARGVTDTVYRFLGEMRTDQDIDILLRPAAAALSPIEVSVHEPLAGSFRHRIAVPLDRAAGDGGAFASVAQVGGSARSGEDFEGASSLDAPPGSRVAFMELTVRADSIDEGVEDAVFEFTPVSGLRPDPIRVTVRFNDPDAAATVLYLPNPSSLTEGDTGVRDVPLRLELSRPAGPSGARVRLALRMQGARTNMPFAIEGEDLSLPQPEVVFAPGERVASLLLRVHGDTTPEYDEWFQFVATPLGGIDSVQSGVAGAMQFTISNDDAGIGARGDRFDLLLSTSTQSLSLPVRANDANRGETGWIDGPLSIVRPSNQGRVEAVQSAYGVSGRGAATYSVPERLAGGRDHFRYRACAAYWSTPCAEAEVQLRMLAFPAESYDLRVDADRGHRDFERVGHPSIRGLRFATTPLVAAQVDRFSLAFDPLSADAFDDERGTATQFAPVPATTSAQNLLLFARVAAAASGDIDLYIGLDRDADGRADREETVCSAVMSKVLERCDYELALAADQGMTWWVRVHNRGGAQEVRLERHAIPLSGTPGFTFSAKAEIEAGAAWPWRVAWTLPGLAPGETMAGAVRVSADDGLDLGWVPVRFERESGLETPAALAHESHRRFAIAAGQSLKQAFIDVPPGTDALEVDIETDALVDAHLVRFDAPLEASTAPLVRAVGAQVPFVSGLGITTRRTLRVVSPEAGQWFVHVVNPAAGTALARGKITPRLTRTAAAMALRPGSYFNPARGGHGLFVYPAGRDWAGLWYTYLKDGTPTWYYLQGLAPGDDGLWRAELYRSRWYGAANQLTAVGQVVLSPTASGGAVFSHTLDGETGSEPLSSFGRGCPTVAGRVVDASGHWYDPRRAGSGYSVQLFPNYEFYAVFAYDERGEARYLAAERALIGGASERIPLEQLSGFCPLCPRMAAPTRQTVGHLERDIDGAALSAIRVQAGYVGTIPGRWAANDAVIPLGGLQGCAAN